MEKIKIGKSKKLYEIVDIVAISTSILKVVLADAVPNSWGDITIYTDGGIEATTLKGFDTVYRDEGQTVYLSNDGSVYVPPEEPSEAIPPEPYTPTLQELQEIKKQEVNAACSAIVVAGFDVMLSAGIQHFTLKDEDQIALLTCASLVKDGEQLIPWHPNGDKTIPCVFYSNADMKIITDMAYFHRSYHTTYCNALKVWAEATTSAEQLDLIFYGADVPEQYQSDVLKAYLLQISSMAEGNADETKASK